MLSIILLVRQSAYTVVYRKTDTTSPPDALGSKFKIKPRSILKITSALPRCHEAPCVVQKAIDTGYARGSRLYGQKSARIELLCISFHLARPSQIYFANKSACNSKGQIKVYLLRKNVHDR